jgi:NitT/TauT family transport system substrate-binding protein
MKRILATVTAGIACLAVLSGAALGQGKPEKTDVTIGLPVTTSTFLPLYMAQEEGYFKNQGLNVKIVPFHGGTEMVRAMLAGSVDVGVTALRGVTLGIKAQQPIKVFYGGFDMALFDWYATKNIKSLADTKGKRFGVSRIGSSTDFLTRYALKKSGVDPKEVKIIQGGGSVPRLAAMDAGQLDVNILASPEKFIAADKGYNLVYKQTQIAPDYPFHVFFAPEAFLTKNPNTVKALLRGFVRGVRKAKSDKARSVKLLEERVKLDKKYASRAYDDFIGQIYEDGRLPSKEGMQSFWEIGIMSGDYKEAWPKDRYLDSTFMDSYNEWKPAK